MRLHEEDGRQRLSNNWLQLLAALYRTVRQLWIYLKSFILLILKVYIEGPITLKSTVLFPLPLTPTHTLYLRYLWIP